MSRLIQAILMGICLAGCGYHGSAAKGRVFEVTNPDAHPSEWNLVPLPGVEVTVFWYGSVVNNPVHANSICLRRASGSTDEQGWFELSEWWRRPQLEPIAGIRPVIYLRKEGYDYVLHEPGLDRVWTAEEGTHLLQKRTRSIDPGAPDSLAMAVESCDRDVR